MKEAQPVHPAENPCPNHHTQVLPYRTPWEHSHSPTLWKWHIYQDPSHASFCSQPNASALPDMHFQNMLSAIFLKFPEHSLTLKAQPPWTCLLAFPTWEKMLIAQNAFPGPWCHFTITACNSVDLLRDYWEAI